MPQTPPTQPPTAPEPAPDSTTPAADPLKPVSPKVREIGGPKGPEPTRYGDWEVGGRCSDF
ncbi:hypothetical protein FRZ44_53050 [Hypericibacter terrae]|jgi:hypothetical protein|uniref:DUF1674 domain-containing protein n=1 Tax=Hypericibacter terrae TaxID=2602015 RepID=A0A5J6MV40_9PROT|nr:succinate dehydrogenase assembly factor 4 [Hypericibacter terrae]QEX19990.1 hypothetical protein FRZ44_53050 [Hypericibacter terrae]